MAEDEHNLANVCSYKLTNGIKKDEATQENKMKWNERKEQWWLFISFELTSVFRLYWSHLFIIGFSFLLFISPLLFYSVNFHSNYLLFFSFNIYPVCLMFNLIFENKWNYRVSYGDDNYNHKYYETMNLQEWE